MDYIDKIYCSLQGLLPPETAVDWVVNAFTPGSICDRQYDRALEAYSRLRKRMGDVETDPDVEQIMDAMLQIQRLLCREMFMCGRNYERMR